MATVGRNKAVVLAERLKDINPEIDLTLYEEFVEPDRVWEILRETKPDYVFILPWNLKDEIMMQLEYIREWGGKFVIPIPEVKIHS